MRRIGAKSQAWIVASVVLFGATSDWSWGAAPALTQVFPAGGQRGTTVNVTLTGKFDWPVQVWAPGVDIAVGSESGKLDVTIPADLAADRVWLRLHNGEGASAVVPLLVGNLAELEEQEPNNSPAKAQALSASSVTINGRLEKADVDGFLVAMTAGQTLIAAVDANTRLGSPMDAILQIASADGTVLAENHDAVGLDPRLVFTATKSGPHLVRLFAFPATPDSTIAFRGGSDYVYRLTLTTGPYVTHATPLAVSSANDPVTLHGWNLPEDSQRPVQRLSEPRSGEFAELEPLGELRPPQDARWGFAFVPEYAGAARVRIVPHAVTMAVPPADQLLAVPMAITGWLAMPKQKDSYSLKLSKGQAIVATVDAATLDLPVDPVVQLLDEKGSSVADVDDTGKNRDAVISHTAKADGTYRLTVTDRYRRGSPRGWYRLTVRPDNPDFELTAAVDALVVTPDKPAELVVNVQRRNLGDKAIMIGAESLPEGVTAAEVVAEPKASKVTLKITTTGPAYSGPLRLFGKIAEPELRRQVRAPEKLGATWDYLWLTAVAKPAADAAKSP